MTDIAHSQPLAGADASAVAPLRLVTGYDGSPPAIRALDAAAALLRGRQGSIEIVYVVHLPSVDRMSVDALAEVEADFDEVEKELRASAAAQLAGRGVTWEFQRRQGLIAGQLIAAASVIGDEHPGDVVVIVVGSSSQASHRIVGSVAVGLARHCRVPLVIVPLASERQRRDCPLTRAVPRLGTHQEDHHQAHYPRRVPVRAGRGLTHR